MKSLDDYKNISESMGSTNGYIEKYQHIILNPLGYIDTKYEYADAWARYQILKLASGQIDAGTGQTDISQLPASNVLYTTEYNDSVSNLKDAVDAIMEKLNYVNTSITSFTMSPSTTIYETGSKVSNLKFSWTTNKEVSSQTLTDISDLSVSDRNAEYSKSVTSNKTFTLNVSDGKTSDTKSISISFMDKVYYGSAEAVDDYDSKFILSLDKNNFASSSKGTYSINIADNQYGWICVPYSFAEIKSWYVGGFEVDVVKEATISFTNSSSYAKDYTLYHTTQKSLGSIEIVVK